MPQCFSTVVPFGAEMLLCCSSLWCSSAIVLKCCSAIVMQCYSAEVLWCCSANVLVSRCCYAVLCIRFYEYYIQTDRQTEPLQEVLADLKTELYSHFTTLKHSVSVAVMFMIPSFINDVSTQRNMIFGSDSAQEMLIFVFQTLKKKFFSFLDDSNHV